MHPCKYVLTLWFKMSGMDRKKTEKAFSLKGCAKYDKYYMPHFSCMDPAVAFMPLLLTLF